MWTKDATTRAPLTVYTAPSSAHPLLAVILDNSRPARSSGRIPRTIVATARTVEQVEAVMGL